jgi:penicillin-binding protein 1A
MGGKTGTTNDNSDAWFFGYVPQLLVGTWVGCDDRFIRGKETGGFGGAAAARPIAEAFLKKVYADKTLGIDKDAKFVKPAELENQINSADVLEMINNIPPAGQGDDQGVGSEEDYNYNQGYIGPESKPVVEEGKLQKKDSVRRETTPIGSPADEPKKKNGFFKKLFGGKKDKD